MAIPEEIRRVKRPVNTVVVASGKNSAKKYAVRSRTGVKYIPGGNPQPIYGKVIGHIVNMEYVPLPVQETHKDENKFPSTLSWGGAALLKSVAEDIVRDLLQIFDANRVFTIISMAMLRVLKPHIASNRFATNYKNTFVSVYYPGAALSKNSISTLLSELGQRSDLIELFYQKRIARIEKEHHIAIDGTLRQDTSNVNDLSNFSYKARTKGCEEVSILYAYDIELGEPVCASVFPGNTPDCRAYEEFIRTHNLTKGIIVGDKGYPSSAILQHLKNNKDLHYFNPLKRNSNYIKEYELLKFEKSISVGDSFVLSKKVYVSKENKFLYSFVNSKTSVKEYSGFIANACKQDNFDYETFSQKKDTFGLILFESDLDMSPAEAYNVYKSRWKLEIVFGYYKADITQNQTNVQSDFSVMGAEFINFLSTLLTCRIIDKAQKAGLLKRVNYGTLMDDLNTVRRVVKHTPDNIQKKLKKDDPYWCHVSSIAMDEMIELGLVEVDEPIKPKAKRGRPPKQNKNETANISSPSTINENCSNNNGTTEQTDNIPQKKRPRGRPRKEKTEEQKPKRPRGRPRLARPECDMPKRPRGRPRLDRPECDMPKRPRGRPRLDRSECDMPKRPRGRPRLARLECDLPKRPRGRPRKNPSQEK